MNPYESGAVIDMNMGHNSATTAPIGAPAPRYKIGYRTDGWGERSPTPGGIPDPAGAWVRYDDHVAALASAAQPSDAAWDKVLRERDDADDFIDALLDEVLGADRPEWSNLYDRADALDDVRERMAALEKPAIDRAWGRFEAAMDAAAAPKAAPARWYMVNKLGMATLCADKQDAEQVAADAQAAWPHAGPHRAVQMVEVAAAPTPAAQGDALPREDFAWMVVQEACETEPADEDDPECIRILRRDLKSAVLAAFLRREAARPRRITPHNTTANPNKVA